MYKGPFFPLLYFLKNPPIIHTRKKRRYFAPFEIFYPEYHQYEVYRTSIKTALKINSIFQYLTNGSNIKPKKFSKTFIWERRKDLTGESNIWHLCFIKLDNSERIKDNCTKFETSQLFKLICPFMNFLYISGVHLRVAFLENNPFIILENGVSFFRDPFFETLWWTSKTKLFFDCFFLGLNSI